MSYKEIGLEGPFLDMKKNQLQFCVTKMGQDLSPDDSEECMILMIFKR